jgi:hypothetical protein
MKFSLADENDDVLDRQVGLFAARAKHGPVRPREKVVAGRSVTSESRGTRPPME